MEFIGKIPSWYTTLALLWSIYQGYRGVLEHKLTTAKSYPGTCCEKFLILYLHDFAFRFVCTIAGFCSLFFVYYFLNNLDSLNEISVGASALVASAFVISVIGIGGQLHYFILLGKNPLKPE